MGINAKAQGKRPDRERLEIHKQKPISHPEAAERARSRAQQASPVLTCQIFQGLSEFSHCCARGRAHSAVVYPAALAEKRRQSFQTRPKQKMGYGLFLRPRW